MMIRTTKLKLCWWWLYATDKTKNEEDDDDAKHNKECLHTISLSLHQSLEGSGDHADFGSKERVLKTQLLIFS